MALKLWLISQDTNVGYDTYDSAVVAAKSDDDARTIHPSGSQRWRDGKWVHDKGHDGSGFGWTVPANVAVSYIGDATVGILDGAVVCASFNAG